MNEKNKLSEVIYTEGVFEILEEFEHNNFFFIFMFSMFLKFFSEIPNSNGGTYQ